MERCNQTMENGCPSKTLTVPLKLWPRGTRSKELKFNYHDRKMIAVEYLRLGERSFIEKYDPENCTIKVLKQKIRNENKQNKEGENVEEEQEGSDGGGCSE